MLILSGPVELLILLLLIAYWTCDLVSCIYVVLSLLLFSSPQCVRVLFVIPYFVYVFLPYVSFVLLYEGSYLKV